MTSSDDDQRAAAHRDEDRRQIDTVIDGEPVIIRTAAVSVTEEERAALERGEMPESVLLKALQLQIEDGVIEGMEEHL